MRTGFQQFVIHTAAGLALTVAELVLPKSFCRHAMLQVLSAVVMGVTLPLKLAAEKLVWGKIRDGVGGRVKVVVSGGSSLPSFLEDFFEMAGVRCA